MNIPSQSYLVPSQSYLVDSCGLSHEKAVFASKKVQFETSTKPDLVVTLFRQHDFPNTHISKIIQKYPSLLLAKVDKTLQPKLDFFKSIGLSGPDLANVISKNPNILHLSLEKRIIPSIAFLKGITRTDTDFITVIKRTRWFFNEDPKKRIAPNIEVLRAHGVPDSNIVKLLLLSTATVLKTKRLREIVKEAKKLKLNPSLSIFVRAVSVLSCLSKSSWNAKCEIYKRWGWSKKEIRMAFRQHPGCLMISEKNIMSTMEYFVNKLGFDPLRISKYPQFLNLSLEKRIIPRTSVIKVLVSNGVVKKTHSIHRVLRVTDKVFLDEFVMKYEEKIPELRNVYQGKMNVL